MSRRKSFLFIAILAVVGAGVILVPLALKNREPASRREWKSTAIANIKRMCSEQSALDAQLNPIRQEMSKSGARMGAWVAPNAAVMADGQWLVFQNNHTHRNAEIGDIWIAKGSNGNWYYSTYHFCSDMLVLDLENQPANLDEFISLYYVRQFDGTPDKALEPTWNSSVGFR